MHAEPNTIPLVRLEEITLDVAGKRILSKVDLQVAKGQIVTLIGPNGAGKTTLLRILLGLQLPSAGRVWRQERLRIGYTPQRLSIDPLLPLTVARFLRLSAMVPQLSLEAVCLQVGVARALLSATLNSLSGGELQRILLARALLRAPDLLVLDEPAQGVDVLGQSELYKLITSIRHQQQCGILLVSHDLHVVMAATDEVVCLNTHVCCSGQPQSVSQDPAFLALYSHQHNHHHDLDGQVLEDPP